MNTFSVRQQKVAPENSLAMRVPALAGQLHPTRNPPGTTAHEIAWSSNAKLWWKCQGGPDHEWQETANKRTAKGRRKDGGTGRCPFCSNFRVSVTNSLATMRPDLAAEFDTAKNGGLTAADVTYLSTRMVWWKDSDGNGWQAQVRWRTTQKGRNPFDTGHRLAKARSFAAVHPELVCEWAQDLNGDLRPDQVAAFSLYKAWWRQPGTELRAWQATVADRSRGRGDPFTHGHQVCAANSLETLHPMLAKSWSLLNGTVKASDVTAQSSTPRWWDCEICRNPWLASPKNRARGTNCPVCNEQGLSRAQHRVAWELRYCFPGIPLEKTRIRCDRVVMPGRQRKRNEREIDIPIPTLKVAVEYDGWFWHRRPDKVADDTRKSQELNGAGWRVLRLREAGLPVVGPDDIRIGLDAGNKEPHVVASAVVRWLVERGFTVPNATAYLAAGKALMAKEAAADWLVRMAKVKARKKAA